MNTLRKRIIDELGVQPEINPEEEIAHRAAYLSEYLGTSGLNGFVLGISGGQDSLLAGLLAQKAVEQRRADGFDVQFHAALLPYGEQQDREDALLAVQTITPDHVHDLNIARATNAFSASFFNATGELISDFDKGNVKARMRMIAQYALAGKYGLLVIGTDHAAEAVTGFYTKYGDGGADILPLSGLSKRQGRQLLQTLGVPEVFTTKAPTADLLDGTPGQADETELGLSYKVIDDYLEGKTVTPEAAAAIEKRFTSTIHKRSLPAAYTNAKPCSV